eukprot:1175787-Prorocentrum_minimum.AAC.2
MPHLRCGQEPVRRPGQRGRWLRGKPGYGRRSKSQLTSKIARRMRGNSRVFHPWFVNLRKVIWASPPLVCERRRPYAVFLARVY